MSNAELGKRIGVSHSMASRIRNGKRLPGMVTMQAISREFGVTLDALAYAYFQGPEAFGRLVREHLPGTTHPCPNSTSTNAAA